MKSDECAAKKVSVQKLCSCTPEFFAAQVKAKKVAQQEDGKEEVCNRVKQQPKKCICDPSKKCDKDSKYGDGKDEFENRPPPQKRDRNRNEDDSQHGIESLGNISNLTGSTSAGKESLGSKRGKSREGWRGEEGGEGWEGEESGQGWENEEGDQGGEYGQSGQIGADGRGGRSDQHGLGGRGGESKQSGLSGRGGESVQSGLGGRVGESGQSGLGGRGGESKQSGLGGRGEVTDQSGLGGRGAESDQSGPGGRGGKSGETTEGRGQAPGKHKKLKFAKGSSAGDDQSIDEDDLHCPDDSMCNLFCKIFCKVNNLCKRIYSDDMNWQLLKTTIMCLLAVKLTRECISLMLPVRRNRY